MADYVGIESIKESFRDMLQDNGFFEDAAALNQKSFTEPIFDGTFLHPEQEPSRSNLNMMFQRIGMDLAALDMQMISSAQRYNDLLSEVLLNLDSIDEMINMEKERIEDMSIIVGNYSMFHSVRSLNVDDFSGTCTAQDKNTFSCQSGTRESVEYEIQDVSGNGYEGNSYVYSNGIFESDTMNTSRREKMKDSFSNTYWEYSRLVMPRRVEWYPSVINFDNEEAKCILSLHSDTPFNIIKIQSDLNDLVVEQTAISSDGGITYTNTQRKDISILDKTKKYEDNSYIFGSGVISCPRTNFLKLTLRSGGALNETIAFPRSVFNVQESSLIPQRTRSDSCTSVVPSSDIRIFDGAHRHVVRINDLLLMTCSYFNSSYMETEEILSNPVSSIAVFTNEYIPDILSDLGTPYVRYFLILNGEDYEVVPLNSHKSGIKVIRYSGYSIIDDYIFHINESIKSARLKIQMTTPYAYCSPMISNIKICLGKAVI